MAFWVTEHTCLKNRVHRACGGASATQEASHRCASGHVTPDYTPIAGFFQSCSSQDGITPIVAVQMENDGSIFTKILVKIPVNVIVLKQGFKLIQKVYLHLCWLYNEESLLWLIGQTRVW